MPEVSVLRDAPLAAYTRFGIGGPADLFVETPNPDSFIQALRIVRANVIETVVVGGGTNLIVADEGFRLNARKSRLTTRAGRQIVTDSVVNDRPNLARRDYDTLKEIIHDASRRGPEQANQANVPDFRSHLLGRITWAEQLNPERGARLRHAFATISWWLNPAPWSHGEHAPAMRVEGGSTPPGVSCRLRRHDGRTAGTP